MTYNNEFFGIPSGDTRFNLVAAVDAYEWVLKHPNEARFVLSKALYDNVPADLERHSEVVSKAASEFISTSLRAAKRQIGSTMISKNASGEDTAAVGAAVMAIESISKAYESYTPQERQINVKRQQRDRQGRFVVMARKVDPAKLKQPMTDSAARTSLGVPYSRMNDDTRRKWQNDYMQIRDALNAAAAYGGDGSDEKGMIVRAVYDNGDTVEMPLIEAKNHINNISTSRDGLVDAADYRAGVRIKEITVLDETGASSGPAFDSLAAMASPRFAASAAGFAGEAGDFTNDWTKNGQDDFRTTDQFWRRMGAASQLAATVGAPYLPPAATMALQAGKWVGDLAPEAEKVIGPAARKSAYRYRGVEKKPSDVYQRSINDVRTKYANSNSPQPGREAHRELIQGVTNPDTKEQIDSPLIAHLKTLLPDPQRYHLNRQAGVLPPSQGVIIDRKGKVITEAVGYGEDWYVPFNLKNLGKLDGGEYVRTRAYGGPTTEDIYVGLVSGARAVTVVSHSGVFTIKFDDTFRGSRRFNDKAGRMQDRYGHLLDAVKSKKVRLGEVPQDRLDEIKDEAGDVERGGFDIVRNKRDYQERYNELIAEEKENPRLAQARMDRIALSVLGDYARENGPKGVSSWDDYVASVAVSGDRPKYLAISGGLESAIDYLALTKKYEKEIGDEQAKIEEELKPLDINGRGYYQSMLALKDQFPYYFEDPYWSGGPLKKDHGYVKPRFNRPEGVLEGYYDPSITGRGKITADKTKYQNYPVMSQGKFKPEEGRDITADSEEEVSASGAMVRSSRTSATGDAAKRDLLIDQIKALRAQRVFGPNAVDKDGESIAGKPITDDVWRFFADDQGWAFFDEDEDEIERKIYASKSAYENYKRMADDAFGNEENLFGITKEDVNSEASRDIAGAPPKGAMSIILAMPEIAAGQLYNWPDLKEGQDQDYYSSKINGWMRNAPAFEGVDLSDEDSLVDSMAARNDMLKRALRAAHAGTGSLSEGQIEAEVSAMAKIVQAAKLRESAPPGRRRAAVPTPAEETDEETPFAESGEDDFEEFEEEVADTPEEVVREQRIAQKQAEIHKMVGMKSVSNEIDGLIADARADQWRVENGMKADTNRSHHLVFTGRPGTGKTTVARKLAPIYKDLGIIDSDKVVELKEGDFVGEFSNQINTHVNQVLDDNKGKMIFIDEAYTLLNSKEGKQALDVILQWSYDNKDNSVMVLAGYPDEMAQLMQHNPGMTSRFPTKIHFADYNSKELRQIAGQMIESKMMTVEPKAQVSLNIALGKVVNEDDYSNGRSAETLVQKITRAHNLRMGRTPEASVEERLTITPEDVKDGVLLYRQTAMMNSAIRARNKVAAGIS